MSLHADRRQPYPNESAAKRASIGIGDALWIDAIELLAVSDNNKMAVATRFAVVPQRQCSTLQICLWIGQNDPIVLSEPALEFPERLWEVRGSGLWADHVCESPNEHWSYGLEAFAIAIDDRAELLGRGFGDRVPLGWELEFESTGAVNPSNPANPASPNDTTYDNSYTQRGRVHGIVLTETGEVPFDGAGTRSHQWGYSPVPKEPGANEPIEGGVALPGIEEVWWVARGDGAIITDRTRHGGRA